MTMYPQLGMSEIITLWHFKPPLLNTDIYKSSFFPQTTVLEIGILLQILAFLLLMVQKTVAKFTSLVRARD